MDADVEGIAKGIKSAVRASGLGRTRSMIAHIGTRLHCAIPSRSRVLRYMVPCSWAPSLTGSASERSRVLSSRLPIFSRPRGIPCVSGLQPEGGLAPAPSNTFRTRPPRQQLPERHVRIDRGAGMFGGGRSFAVVTLWPAPLQRGHCSPCEHAGACCAPTAEGRRRGRGTYCRPSPAGCNRPSIP